MIVLSIFIISSIYTTASYWRDDFEGDTTRLANYNWTVGDVDNTDGYVYATGSGGSITQDFANYFNLATESGNITLITNRQGNYVSYNRIDISSVVSIYPNVAWNNGGDESDLVVVDGGAGCSIPTFECDNTYTAMSGDVTTIIHYDYLTQNLSVSRQDGCYFSVILTCYAPDFSINLFSRQSDAMFGDFIIQSGTSEAPPTNETPPSEAPIVTINYPTSYVYTYNQPVINFTAVDNDDTTLSCSLFVNGLVSQTNPSVSNNTETSFNPTLSDGHNQYYVNCTDETNIGVSSTQDIYFNDKNYFYFRDDFDGNLARLSLYGWSSLSNIANSGGGIWSTQNDDGGNIIHTLPINYSDENWNMTVRTTRITNSIFAYNRLTIGNLFQIWTDVAWNNGGDESDLVITDGGMGCAITTKECDNTLTNAWDNLVYVNYDATTKNLSVRRNDSCYVSVILSSCNMTGYDLNLHPRTGYNYFMDFAIQSNNITPSLPSNAIPSIVINTPANNTISLSQPTIDFTVTDNDNTTLSCGLYVDSVFNASNPSVSNNTLTSFNPILTFGSHTFYVTCTDNIDTALSGVYTYDLYDNSIPSVSATASLPAIAYKNDQLKFNVTCVHEDTLSGSIVAHCQLYNSTVLFDAPSSTVVSNNTNTNLCDVLSNTVQKGETYLAEFYCSDNITNGAKLNSSSITIQNTAPIFTQSDFTINQSATKGLSIQINATDFDNEPLTYSINSPLFTINPSSGLLNRTGQASVTAGTHNVTISVFDGTVIISMWVLFVLTQESPTLNVIAPVNQSLHNTHFDLSYRPTDSDTSVLQCLVYHNSILVSNVSVNNNTLTTLNTPYSLGINIVNINCNDGLVTINSGDYQFYFDDESPTVFSVSPNMFNTSSYSGFTMNLLGNVTNYNLSFLNRTILYTNGSVFFNDVVTNFPDPTKYSWNDNLDTTSLANGVYTYSLYSYDTLNNTKDISLTFTIANCYPEWICNGYATCNQSDLRPCNSVSDSNICGDVYSGDYSEFSPISCNFCSGNFVLLNETACVGGLNTQCHQDLNFSTCCDVTNIASDCYDGIVQNLSIVCGSESCSQFNYEEGDIQKALFNTIVKFILGFRSLLP